MTLLEGATIYLVLGIGFDVLLSCCTAWMPWVTQARKIVTHILVIAFWPIALLIVAFDRPYRDGI